MEPEEEEGVLDTLTAVALYDYLAHAPDELTIAKGEVVMVLEEYDDGWWLVGNYNDDAGVVPSNYLSPFTTQGNDQTVDSLRGIEHVDAETAASSNMIDHGTLYKLTKVHDSSESSHHAYRSSDTIGSQNPEQQPKNASSHKKNKKRQVESKFDEAGRAETQVGRSEYVKLPDITSPQHSRESTEPLQLDHVSLERLTEEITSRVSHELSLRDQKLMEHVKDIIAQSVTPLPLNTEQQQLYRESSHSHAKVKPQREDCASNPSQDFPSKIPVRVALPKLVEPQAAAVSVSKLSRAPNLQGHKELVPGERGQDYGDAFVGDVVMPKRRPSIGDSKLPILLNRNARKSAGPDSEEEVSRPKDDAGSVGTENSRAANSDGIHYPQCRSVVYAPSCVVEAPPPQPSATLSLHHIYGYDGDFTRHGSNLHAKNILWADEERVIYPAAAVVVVQNVRDRRQGFFCGHSEDVTCVAIHPRKEVAASSQLGKDCVVLLWDVDKIGKGISSSKSVAKLKPASGVRGVSGLSFSGDGRLLIAHGVDESHSLMVFDWKDSVLIATAKLGHNDVSQIVFNSYLYSAIDSAAAAAALAGGGAPGGADSPQKAVCVLSSCYTIVSFGGKQIKFWTLKEEAGAGGSTLEDISTFKGRKLNQKKGSALAVKYSLEGNLAKLPNKKSMPEITSFAISNDSLPFQSVSSTSPKARVFFGTVEGSVYIWEQVEDASNSGVQAGCAAWLPRGRLVSVVTALHDAPIMDMDYVSNHYGSGEESVTVEKFVTSCAAGIVNVWQLNREQGGETPMDHLGSFALEREHARSVAWDRTGEYVILGTAANSVMLLTYNEVEAPVGGDDGEIAIQVDIQVKILNQSHDGKVRRLAVHPVFGSVLATVSSDKSVRLWTTSMLRQCACLNLPDCATSVAFSADGRNLTAGNEKGELYVFESEEVDALLNGHHPDAFSADAFSAANWKMKLRKSVVAKTDGLGGGGGGGKRKSAARKCEIIEIKYSPDGAVVAVGCKDNLIHILSVSAGYKHTTVCRGHSSWVKNIDFSIDGRLLRSSDAARELLHWDAQSGQCITNATAFRDVEWNSVSCVYGWGVLGVFNGADGRPSAEGDINCVCCSPDGEWLVAGGSYTVHNAVKLFNYPCLADAVPSYHGGHTSPVLDVAFLVNGDDSLGVVTAGGNDSCFFQWVLVENSSRF